MDDVDEDFGDLYADVELQTTSVINTAPHYTKTHSVNNEVGNQNSDYDRACVSVDNNEIEEEEEEDDDDDDLDIVLNSDNDSVKPSEGFVTASVKNRELDDEDNDNSYVRSQTVAYGSDLKGVGCVSAAYWQQLGARSVGAQAAQRFSLPRARNILDVNIDIFEQKPWNHPGVDITDYFNFGFNEDSWKVYCNQVDEYRHRGPVSSETPPSEPAQSTEVDTRKGQAIQVEGSIFERQSSMDVRRQLDRDSDAIQITILDPEDTFVPEASNHVDVSGDNVTDHLSFSSASEDESVEEKYVDTDVYPPKMRSDSDDCDIHQVVTDETTRTSNDTKESNLVEESSEAEKTHANYYKSFEDDACFDRRKVYTHDRCHSKLSLSVKPDYYHAEESNKFDDKRGPDENRYHARRLGDNRKYDDRIYRERSNSPVYKNRTHKDLNLKTHHENDYVNSIRTYDKRKSVEYRYHARHNNDFFHMSDEGHSTFRRRLHAFDPYEENISNPKSEVPSDYYGERFCGYDWDTKRCETNMDRALFRSSAEDEYYDERRSYIEDNRIIEGNWCKYEKGQKKGENLYSRNKGEIDEFYLDTGYYDDTHGESFRSVTHDDRKRDDIEYTRWEFRGPGRHTRRVCSLFSKSDNPLLKDNEQAFASRYEQSFVLRSPAESHINDCRWDGNRMPRSSVYRRHETYRGQHFEPFDREDDMIDVDGRVNTRRRRCPWRSEIVWEDEIMFRHNDAKSCAHKNSFPFGKVSRCKRIVSEPDPDHDHVILVGDPYVFDGSSYVKELTDGHLANGCRYSNQKNEVFNGNKCSKAYEKSRERLPLSSRNSHMEVGKVKSSKKHMKPKWKALNTCISGKVSRADETRAVDDVLDIEEGQIVTKEVQVGPMHKTRAHVNGSHNQNGKSGFDSTRILEAMAKMEKRRARFSETVDIARKDSDSSIKLTVGDPAQETCSNKQQRPARKRRWGASK